MLEILVGAAIVVAGSALLVGICYSVGWFLSSRREPFWSADGDEKFARTAVGLVAVLSASLLLVLSWGIGSEVIG